ncbi:hypothetical protein [Geomicrobium sp. JCM 19055]|uniref:hypothetical protein n=1 Tax=Geomicrobium sp. JCM 19055 TaxID=1460649 RepID=UPI0012683229|nr:hypothetical protein [Geomicrobium sp. JCM 19055]
MNKHKTYVGQLLKEDQKAINNALVKTLFESGLRGEELKQAVQDGMGSRVCDLADTINVDVVVEKVKDDKNE